jgi:plasmid maintenance system antidote protein VapI
MTPRDPLDGTMTGAELRELLEQSGLTQAGFARALGLQDRTIRKFLSGEAAILPTVAFAIRWVTMRKHRGALRRAAGQA